MACERQNAVSYYNRTSDAPQIDRTKGIMYASNDSAEFCYCCNCLPSNQDNIALSIISKDKTLMDKIPKDKIEPPWTKSWTKSPRIK